MSAHLAQFVVEFEQVAECVVASEGNPLVTEPCPCGEGLRTTRCKDCLGFEPTCDKCFLRCHASTPFHVAEKWNGRYFDRMSQASLGRILHFGHRGSECPSVKTGTMPLGLDVIDLNGIHSCKVQYCQCAAAGEHWEQLLAVDLFPGTLGRPATAFSIPVLKHFDLLSSISKTSAMDFVTTLRRTTNNAFPDDVPVSAINL